ncbi:hypothetical protein KKE60_05300 [Patescibacteria group bacterium]|nr:hypothetical protein [Patescibacteria group bacterium]
MVGQIVLLVTQIPCNSISKRQDQTLKVRVNYTYQGPAMRGRLGAVVTQKGIISEFDEISSTRKEVYVDLPAAITTPQSLATDIAGLPLAGCAAKAGYGIKVYALDLDGKPEWGCLNVLTVTAPVEGFLLATRALPLGAGWVTKTPDKTRYNYGEIVTLLANKAPGYRFNYWDVDGEWLSTDNPINFAVFADHTVTAHFTEL